MVNEELSRNVYQKITLRPEGLGMTDLTSIFEISEEEIIKIISGLKTRGLVILDGSLIRAVPWWNEEHLEISLNIPMVQPDIFQVYCIEIDQLHEVLKKKGYDALRPYKHETSIEIVLGVAATLLLAEFLNSFLSELRMQLVEFVNRVINKYRDKGITEVEIKIERKSNSGDIFVIMVKGSDFRSINERLTNLIQTMMIKENLFQTQEKVHIEGEHCEATLKKKDGFNIVSILFLTANPSNTTRLRLDEEIREIDQALRKSDFRDRFDIKQHWAVRVTDFQGLLLRHKPDIVHFSGHGSKRDEIILEDSFGISHPVSVRALSRLFSLLKDNIRCVFLNACNSNRQAQAIAKNIDCVIGISKTIGDKAAISFSQAFYEAIGYGRDIKTAFDLGCNLIDLKKLGEKDKPKLLALKCNPEDIVFVHNRKLRRFVEV
jgi:hypothetical protein